jgi:glutathione S-transferase
MSSGAKLYVIPGSHACRAAMLMLDYKGIAYRVVELPTGAHPTLVRALGFPGHAAPIRQVEGSTRRALAMLDRMGTVPALRFGSERIQTNHEIARFLDRIQPQPPLFPADGAQRREVEAAEQWGDGELQMAARRIVLIGSMHGLDTLRCRGNEGRLGPLLSKHERMRVLNSRLAARAFFGASLQGEQGLLATLPSLLEKVDAWVEQGVLGGPQLNAADFTIAPSLALLAYRLDLRGGIEARPAGKLLERVLPEPVLAA